MEGTAWTVVAFGAGVAAGCLNLALQDFEDFDGGDLLACFFIGLLAVIAGFYKDDAPAGDPEHWLKVFVVFSLVFGLAYKKRILPRIDKFTVYYFTLVYGYYVYTLGSITWAPLYAVTAIPAGISIISAMVRFELSDPWKLFYYVWFMLLMAVIGVMGFNQRCFVFFGSSVPMHPGWLEMFVSGMAMNYVVVMLANAVSLVPLPGRGQSFSNRMAEVRDSIQVFESKVLVQDLPLGKSGLITLCLGLVLGANLAWHLIQPALMGSICIVVLPPLFGRLFLRDAGSSDGADPGSPVVPVGTARNRGARAKTGRAKDY